jgi:hypothetical protein
MFKKDTCTLMFITTPFTIARMWNQPRCPSTNEWIKKNIIHTHNGALLSHKEKIMSFAAKWIESEIMLSETSQTEKDKHHAFSFICGI